MTELGVMETISRRRLRELEAKERAHDVYREACRAMRSRATTAANLRPEWWDGYRAAVSDFDTCILEADYKRGAPESGPWTHTVYFERDDPRLPENV